MFVGKKNSFRNYIEIQGSNCPSVQSLKQDHSVQSTIGNDRKLRLHTCSPTKIIPDLGASL